MRRRHAHGRTRLRRSPTSPGILDVHVSSRHRVAASTPDGVSQAHSPLGRASRSALSLRVGRGAAQVWTRALPRHSLASARSNGAEAGQARMVAPRFHERAMGAQGHWLLGEVRDQDSNIVGAVSEGLRLHGHGGLSGERRVYRSWWMLPKYQRERCEPADRVRRARGGAWRSMVTGEWWESVAYSLGGWRGQLSALSLSNPSAHDPQRKFAALQSRR